ncbi:uncharacterized protein PAC_05723 [Phialocephala subalpina]|uniref:2EXR domain-containing protein n=1 Tax=Phialocephala subalpina TaxID=576137 RepID=A0A1L7WST8_9HELO|nr:uncharacterized protein PAC_05723 [Phialocephala subalpina]
MAFNKAADSGQRLEQPDFAEGRTSKDFDDFQLFPRLPIELRLSIWRLSFPEARHVSLDTGFGGDSSIWVHSFRENVEHPLPITLHINHESRAETLRHYTILFIGDLPRFQNTEKRFDRPCWFDLSRDSLWLEAEGLESLDYDDTTWIDEFLDLINGKAVGGTASIRILEMRHSNWEKCTDFSDIWNEGTAKSRKRGLEWFHGLDKLILTSDNIFVGSHHAIEKNVKGWYQKYRANEPTCRIPEITVRESSKPPKYGIL